MLSDLLARLFVAGFFMVYLVVMILLCRWAIRTWPGSGRRRSEAKPIRRESASKTQLTIEKGQSQQDQRAMGSGSMTG